MALQPRFKKSSSLLPRAVSAAVLIPICLYLLHKGPPLSLILGGFVAFGLFLEWGRLLLRTSFPPLSKTAYAFLGTLYIGIATFWLFQNLTFPEGWRITYLLLCLVWTADSGAYGGGKFFKGAKLAPSISPHKTWSGFLTGIASGTLITYGATFWILPGVFSFWGILALALVSQLGDLLESKAKRWGNVKDSGALIPGHGGLLDRLDSLLAVSFALAVWQLFS